ncbi:DUF659 domain-containing protein [Artemisia annua]|uniref:DUF659 domain-containing protein n=1 Tax=Artemisia annua TaxID=35608 RepID=A0A2U1MLW7_ARTAN|nr:DUF659 domain-containing protein [Artemisia annua]
MDRGRRKTRSLLCGLAAREKNIDGKVLMKDGVDVSNTCMANDGVQSATIATVHANVGQVEVGDGTVHDGTVHDEAAGVDTNLSSPKTHGEEIKNPISFASVITSRSVINKEKEYDVDLPNEPNAMEANVTSTSVPIHILGVLSFVRNLKIAIGRWRLVPRRFPGRLVFGLAYLICLLGVLISLVYVLAVVVKTKEHEAKRCINLAKLCEILVELNKHETYSLLDILTRLILTLPVSNATNERSLSAMKLFKIQLRNKMANKFLAELGRSHRKGY